MIPASRPTVGKLVVPYMVDATRSPVDFKVLDAGHVDQCAMRTRCGICGARIRRRPIAFIGPDDGRTCFADPWMHPDCADLALAQCPFLAGRRDWREDGGPLLRPYSDGMIRVLANNWRSHRDPLGNWHFEAVGGLA
jgi:hypothetical protein